MCINTALADGFIPIFGLHIGLHKCPKTTLKRPKSTQKKAVTLLVTASLSVTPTGFKPVTA
jgi:hypothetical protein